MLKQVFAQAVIRICLIAEIWIAWLLKSSTCTSEGLLRYRGANLRCRMAGVMTRKPLLISVGEALWDLLPGGKELGGTAANLAFHAHALGAEAVLVSSVGNDDDGREILAALHAIGMATHGISTDREAPT